MTRLNSERHFSRYGTFKLTFFCFFLQLSIADLALFCTLDFWKLKDSLEGCPKIVGVLKKVEENERLAKYLKERKDSPF